MHRDCRVERRKNWQYHRRSLNSLDLLRSTFREGAILLYRDTRSCPARVSKLHGEERGILEPPPPPPIIWTRPQGRNCRFTCGMHDECSALAPSQSALVDWRWCRNGHDVKPSLTLFTAQLVLLFPRCGFARSSSLKWQQLRRPRNGKPSNKLWPPGPAALGAIVRRERRHSCQCRQDSRFTAN
jgi:hypothetical protein